VKTSQVIRAWGKILSGGYPSLSIEITRECPLRCPGCYAYEPEHLGSTGLLRSLADYKSQELIDGVLALVERHRPMLLSIVGGEPLVRFRELSVLLPIISSMGIEVQVVTSAVRKIPTEWAGIDGLHLVVSIDGLEVDHDARRKPATYRRILENIKGLPIKVHCTITRQMTEREGYFRKFLEFWSPRDEVIKIWFSIFTPQIGAADDEILPRERRLSVLDELAGLRAQFPKMFLPDDVIDGFRSPPKSPGECIFSQTTANYTADLKTRFSPCQFGGNPDCSQCGCMASAGVTAIGSHKLLGAVKLDTIFKASTKIGSLVRRTAA
jgi:sulfatase maturation enzyme AslB (radical SAM superfamily)